MKKLLVITLAALFAISCEGPSAKMDVTINGLEDSTVVLCKLNYNKLVIVDSIKTDANGAFSYKVKLANEAPAFYYLYCNQVKLAGMVLLPSDKVKITADASGKYDIEGSPESTNLKTIDDALAVSLAQLKKLSDKADNTSDEKELAQINSEASKIYIEHKRNLLRQIMKNPTSITSATALFQKLNENLPVFSQNTDVFVFKTIYDSLSVVYPSSEYLIALMDEIDRRQTQIELINKLNNIQEQGYPYIALPDINGKETALASLDGKLVILSFWSVTQNEHKMFNNALLEIYDKYHDKGLEIYQVSIDTDKASWASTVRSQNLPWISVNDGLGVYSPSIAAYNVTQIPSMFVISKEGDIIERDLFDETALEKLVKNNL